MYRPPLKATIFFFIEMALLLFVVSNSSPLQLYKLCPLEKGNYTSNSSFANNLKQLLNMLASTVARTGFETSSVGTGTDQVFGQVLCRGDVRGIDCHDCVSLAAQEIMSDCSTTDADIWYDSCQVSYSSSNFLSVLTYLGKFPDRNGDSKHISDPGWSNSALEDLMDDLKAKVRSSGNRFGTGKFEFSNKASIYGLAQCTREINGDDCGTCLGSAIGDLTSCCSGNVSGTVVSRYCNVRFDLHQFYNDDSSGNGTRMKILLGITIPASILAASICYFLIRRHTKKEQIDEEKNEQALLKELGNSTALTVSEEGKLVSSREFFFMDFAVIRAATSNFSDLNKLGEGGFGKVYRGVLHDGSEIAVKRLSKKSMQGLEEVKNEIVIIAELKHRNLVRLLGWSIEGDEKLLIYEFMANRSLDNFLFNPRKSWKLDWRTRYNIIDGIARGLLYLHEDSRLKIIHRDLKPSNVLLDEEMVAKISDFGMARIFSGNQYIASTKRLVGTIGYMAPEYAMEGVFSVKSDVFSFGVIVLEIISGKKNSAFQLTKNAWMLWKEEKEVKLIDPFLLESSAEEEARRCIHIGLLCMQEDPADRPTMSDVVILLQIGVEGLPEPRHPGILKGRDSSMNSLPSFSSYTSR